MYKIKYNKKDKNYNILPNLLKYNEVTIQENDNYSIEIDYITSFTTITDFTKQTILDSNICINSSYFEFEPEKKINPDKKNIALVIVQNYLVNKRIPYIIKHNRVLITINNIINNITDENTTKIKNIFNYITNISDINFNHECTKLYTILQKIEDYIEEKDDNVKKYLNNKNRLSVHKRSGYVNGSTFPLQYSIVSIFDNNFVLQIDNYTAEVRIMISDDIDFIKTNPHNYQNKWLKCYILKILHLRLLKNELFNKFLTLSFNNQDNNGNDLYYIVYDREIYICQKLLILIKHYDKIKNDLINISNQDLSDLIKIYEEPNSNLNSHIYTILFD